jgi:hypothetical protein
MDYRKINTIVGWMVFIFATTVYFMTLEPTTSLWDCGEYITTAYKLEVGHPPGAPLFMMLGRLFSMFGGPDGAAMMVNGMSALSSSFTILFLFWTITLLAKKTVLNPGIALFNKKENKALDDLLEGDNVAPQGTKNLTEGQKWAILGSGLIGALAYTFTDSFWFSAVEGEVYAMSSFFTAIVVWAIFKWDDELGQQEAEPDNEELKGKNADRWIVFIFFMIGLSIGVHLLNLLCIPAIAYVIYFRKYKETTPLGFILTGVIGVVALGLIQAVLIPQTVKIAGWFERVFVNNFGMGFNTGTIFFFTLLLAIIVIALMWSKRSGRSIVNTTVWSFTMILIGYSCFAMIVIRSNANTPLDENDPENLVSLEAYLKREQYGDWPILHGPYFNSELNQREDWADRSDVYLRRFVVIDKKNNEVKGFKTEADAKKFAATGNYTITEKYFKTYDGSNSKPTYKAEESTIFPRMYSPDQRHVDGYISWSGCSATEIPSMSENLTYFRDYQVGWMYWRYFMWNFSGRQSDEQGHGNSRDGNWISGLNFIDKHHIGDQTNAPSIITDNPSHNKFYMLPLILGLIGFIFMLTRSTKGWWLIMLLFLLTGFAIIIYLNQKPMEPRERDYAYAASFYAFSIWIGMSVLALYDAFKNMVWKELGILTGSMVLFAIILLFGGPTGAISMLYITVVITALFALMILLRDGIKVEKQGAILSLIIALPVPIIMGMAGWDDHDRSDRYTAQALAHNYLNSCGEQAIIFTNGDNDTFPLWYLQEVEGKRTDVRVCNLSLLNTDWYTEQMTRRAYESDPLPISFEEEQYRQNGNLDYMQIYGSNQLTMTSAQIEPKWRGVMEKKIESNPQLFAEAYQKATNTLFMILSGTNFAQVQPEALPMIAQMYETHSYFDFRYFIIDKLLSSGDKYGFTDQHMQSIQQVMLDFNDAFDYLPADYIMDFLADEKNIHDFGRGQQFFIIPTRGLSVEVNKENAKKAGIITDADMDRVVDVVRWKISKRSLYKADLMILDMIAHFNWERPIYFASSASTDTYLGLDEYFFSEGLVYKFVPIRVDKGRNPNSLGEINKDQTYKNLMEVFEWGNMDKEGTLVDYYTRRLTNNYRVQFSVLADAYADEYESQQRKIEIMKQVQAQGMAADTIIRTPVGDINPSKIDEDIKIAEAAMTKAQNRIDSLLDRSFEVMPHENVPFGKVIPSYISAYYVAGSDEKAQQYTDQMFELFKEEMDYYLDVDPKFSTNMITDMYTCYRSMFSLYQATAVFGDNKEYQEKITGDFLSYTDKVQKGVNEMKLYCNKRKDYATAQRLESTFGGFFKQLNGQ